MMIILATKLKGTQSFTLSKGLDGFYELHLDTELVHGLHDDEINRLMVAHDDDQACYDNDDRLAALIENYELQMEGV